MTFTFFEWWMWLLERTSLVEKSHPSTFIQGLCRKKRGYWKYSVTAARHFCKPLELFTSWSKEASPEPSVDRVFFSKSILPLNLAQNARLVNAPFKGFLDLLDPNKLIITRWFSLENRGENVSFPALRPLTTSEQIKGENPRVMENWKALLSLPSREKKEERIFISHFSLSRALPWLVRMLSNRPRKKGLKVQRRDLSHSFGEALGSFRLNAPFHQ